MIWVGNVADTDLNEAALEDLVAMYGPQMVFAAVVPPPPKERRILLEDLEERSRAGDPRARRVLSQWGLAG